MLVPALRLTVWLSIFASVGVGLVALRSKAPPLLSARPTVLAHPLAQLLLLGGLLYVNQVLFSVYVLRVFGGSVQFIGRYIAGPWFAIGARDPLVRWLLPHVNDGRWLSFSVLRVQAFLELPFTMFAYLAVARLYGHRLYRDLCQMPLLFTAAISFSVTFSIIEMSLPNPWTHDDLVLRALSALLTPMYIAWTSRHVRAASEPKGTFGILGALAAAGAIAYVVLAIYDAFLLYNLGHLPRYAIGLPVATAVAISAPFAASKPSPVSDFVLSTLRAFTVLFFVPSLALRYFGAHAEAAALGFLLVLVALGYGAATARSRLRLAAFLPFAVMAGAVAAWWSVAGMSASTLPELVLARLALSFLGVTIVVLRGLEIALCWAAHETKADVDQA